MVFHLFIQFFSNTFCPAAHIYLLQKSAQLSEYEKSLKNYEKTNLTSMQEVNDSLVSVNMDKEKLSKQRKIQELEQKDFKLSQDKFNQGVIAKLDLNQMEENLLSVNKMVYSSEFDCMIDYISFYKAIAAQNI